jgi:hypothetical protein
MATRINDILQRISGYPLTLFSGSGTAEITSVGGTPDGKWLPDVLYVLTGSTIFACGAPTPGSCLLYAGSGELPTHVIGDGTTNILLLTEERLLAPLLDEIRSLLAEELYVTAGSARIFEAMLRRRTPQAVLDAANRTLNLPMVAADTTQTIYAHSCDPEIYGEADWDSFVTSGVVPSFLGDGSSRIVKSLMETPSGVLTLTENPELGVKNIIADMLYEGQRVGRLSILLARGEPQRREVRLISAMCEALATMIGRESEGGIGRGGVMEAFLTKLVEGGQSVTNFIQAQGQSFNYPREGFFRVMVIDLDEHMPFERSVESVISYLEVICPGTISAVCSRRLVMLTNYVSQRAYDNRDETEFLEFVKKYSLPCGVGREFTDIRRFQAGYTEAVSALELSYYICRHEPLGVGFRPIGYEQFESYIEAMHLYRDGQDLNLRAHPAVIALRDYDEKYRTTYYDTLRVYLQCAMKTQLTAEKLCVHRNSLEYRLRKIKSITDVDWDNGDLMARLWRSFVYLEFIKMAAGRERFLRDISTPMKF